MSLFQEFKQFVMRGNVVDLAVGVIIGAAFGKIVTVLVEKVLMPPLGLLIGGMDFSQLRIVLQPASEGRNEVAINYGEFVQASVNFLIVAAAVFALVKAVNLLKRQHEKAPSPPPEEILILKEIRDLLKNR